MAGASREGNSSCHDKHPRGGSRMTAKDKLVEQSCKLAELKRLAAHKR
jgi:hypothetical protein